jgi:hypothetical protein
MNGLRQLLARYRAWRSTRLLRRGLWLVRKGLILRGAVRAQVIVQWTTAGEDGPCGDEQCPTCNPAAAGEEDDDVSVSVASTANDSCTPTTDLGPRRDESGTASPPVSLPFERP